MQIHAEVKLQDTPQEIMERLGEVTLTIDVDVYGQDPICNDHVTQ